MTTVHCWDEYSYEDQQKIIEENPDAKIILHGISMGGATVMMCAGENLPSNVKGIVDDCGYTSVWDIFSDELSVLFHSVCVAGQLTRNTRSVARVKAV